MLRCAVELVLTPQIGTSFSVCADSEHGMIGMSAAQRPLNQLPLMPESVWRAMSGGQWPENRCISRWCTVRYAVQLVSSPWGDASFSVQSDSEHGIIGTSAA